MPRWYPQPVRRVAEAIAAGTRSYFSLLFLFDTTERAVSAITEMKQEGVIEISRTMEIQPTATFPAWLEELRRREDNPRACEPARQTGTSPQAVLRPEAVNRKSVQHIRKPYFRHLSSNRKEAAGEMAARIRATLQTLNKDTMTLSAVKRRLHANRYPDVWQEALAVLVRHRIARVADGKITLLWPENDPLPDPYDRADKPKGRRRRREQSDWFQQHRPKMDEGQHSDFEEDWDDENDPESTEEFWDPCDDDY